MSRNFPDYGARASDETAPTEGWLFAQVILGKPIPRIVSPEARARAKREELQRLAQFSSDHADELRRLDAAEAKAREDRELLEFAASICTQAEAKLAALLRKEAQEREAWRRAEQFYESYVADTIEWDEADHPRQPKGTPEGGEWAPKGGGAGGTGAGKPSSALDAITQRDRDATAQPGKPEAAAVAFSPDGKTGENTPTGEPKSEYVRNFDKDHDLSLQSAVGDGKLSAGDILRLKFTDEEVKQILKSAEKPGSDLNLNFYTAENLPPALRAKAEKDFANLPGDEKYAMQAFVSNQRRARVILMARNPAFQQYVGELYGFLRSLNPTHFMFEKGMVVGSGKEPVLGGEASRLDALKDMLIYLAIMKGVSWGIGKVSNIIAGPEATGDVTIGFEGGGNLTIRSGAEYDAAALESAVERAAAGEKVIIEKPVPKPPRPSLTEVPSVKDGPQAFRRWFNELTPEEFKAVWRNQRLRKAVENGLRWPGGQHEWLMVGRAPKFKEWGLSAEEIAAMRTPISKIRFKNPRGGHEGAGAQTTHNQIKKIIDSSPDFATYKARLQEWANDRLEGGADALPPGLRP